MSAAASVSLSPWKRVRTPVRIGRDAIVAAGSAVSRDVAPGDLRMVRAEQLVKDGWADRFHDAMKKKKAAEKKG